MAATLSKHPVHLGLGATAVGEPEFTGKMDWYRAYGERHAADGAEGRLVSMFTFSESWDSWEMHPQGHEVVLCTAGEITLVQEIKGEERRQVLRPGQYAINEPGVWHTADVDGSATAVFITAGLGTQMQSSLTDRRFAGPRGRGRPPAMSRRRPTANASRPRPLLAFLTVAIGLTCLLAQVAGAAHMVLVPHERCAEHGEMVHAGDHRDVHAEHGAVAPTEGPAVQGALRSDGHEHDHCQFLSERRKHAVSTDQRSGIGAPPLDAGSRCLPVTAENAQATYSVAPKTSPPV